MTQDVNLKEVACQIIKMHAMASIMAEHLSAIAKGIAGAAEAKESAGLRSLDQATIADMINKRLAASHAKAIFLLREAALHFRPGKDGTYPLMTDELWAKIEGNIEAVQEAPEPNTATFEEQDCPCPDYNKDRAEAAAKTETPSTNLGECVRVDMIEVRL